MGFFEAVADAVETVVDAVVDAVNPADDDAEDEDAQAAPPPPPAGEGVRRVVGAVATAMGAVAREGARAAEAVLSVVEDAAEDVARGARKARGQVAGAGPGDLPEVEPYRERRLTDKEEDFARPVFGDTSLPYGAIYISSGLGFGRRRYTIPHPTELGAFLIHFGPTGYDDPTDSSVAATFIHELAHVWQGYNYLTPFDYIVNSLFSQFVHRDSSPGAYTYTPGKEWWEYNVEQQASIVEDWFSNGMLETDELFPYIRDHIRPGEP